MGDIGKIFLAHHFDGDLHIGDLFLQIAFNDLFPSSGQFIQIQKADASDGILGVFCGSTTYKDRRKDQNQSDQQHSQQGHGGHPVISFLIHVLPPSLPSKPSPRLEV